MGLFDIDFEDDSFKFTGHVIDVSVSRDISGVFVEVKTRSTDVCGTPIEAVTKSKYENIKKGVYFYLEDHKVQTRNLFAGNLLKHPAFEQYEENKDYRVVGSLPVTDSIMRDSFWLGLYPGMTPEKLQYMIDTIKAFVASRA